MKVKLTSFDAPDDAPLAIYITEHVPAIGDMIRLPGCELREVVLRIWQPPYDEVIVAVRVRADS